jgi:hypothetical protein
MRLIFLGYCANLAYVIHVNEVSVSFEIKLCRFGMVPFGTMLRISKAIGRKRFYKKVKREN